MTPNIAHSLTQKSARMNIFSREYNAWCMLILTIAH